MAEQLDITTIDRPYDNFLNRSPSEDPSTASYDSSVATETSATTTNGTSSTSSSNGNVQDQTVKEAGAVGDIWVNTFIRSTNWKPKTQGFTIEGQNGYAEFCNVYVSGNINAFTGNIGGWIIGTSTLTDIAGLVGLSSLVTVGDDIRIWAGNVNPSLAPFYVTEAGVIKAISGIIANWTLSSSAISTGAFDTIGTMYFGTSGLSLSDSFMVTSGGALTATSATITGSITANSGSIGSFTIGTYLYTGTKISYNDVNAGVHLGSDGIGIGNNLFTVSGAGVLSAVSGTVGGCALSTTSIGSTTFVSGPLGSGWNISNSGVAEFQNVSIRGIIKTSVFEKDTVSAVNGIVLVSSADILSVDMSALDASTVTISGQTTFSTNEVIRIKDGTDDEWMLVTSAVSAPTYTVTRDLVGSYAVNTNPIWKKGTTVVSMGVGTGTKTGYISLDSSSSYSPYIDIYGRNSNTYTDTTLHARIGWLKGITDANVGLATTDVWGIYTDNAYIKGTIVADTGYIGGTSGWVISSNYIKDVSGLTGLSSLVTGGDDIRFWAGNTTPSLAPFSVTESGALLATSAVITGAITATSGTFAGITAANINVGSSGNIRGGQTDYETGSGFFLGYSSNDYKFSVGDIDNYLKWDGTYLKLKGSFDVGTGGVINNSSYTVANLPVVPTTVGFNDPTGNDYAETIQIECWGAGAGGSNSNNGSASSGGGGGGAYSKVNAFVASTSYSIVVGTGGASVGANNDGQDGGDSTFNTTTCVAKGGTHSIHDVSVGTGGSAAAGTGDVKYSGGNGVGTQDSSGGGGSSAGTGANGNNAIGLVGGVAPTGGAKGGDGATGSTNGYPGSFPGGGGGGTYNAGFGGIVSGAGANGQVVIKYLTSKFGVCTGGAITTGGGYTTHTFTSNGTFTVVPLITDPTNAYTSDASYMTMDSSVSGVVGISVSKDAGVTYSPVLTNTFTAVEAYQTYGSGSTELWGTSFSGAEITNTNFRLKITHNGVSHIYKNFGFAISASYVLTGLEIRVQGKYIIGDAKNYINDIDIKIYYGTSVLPIQAGSQVYASNGRKTGEGAGGGTGVLVFFDGTNWCSVIDGFTITA